MSPRPVGGEDFVAAARFIQETASHVRSLAAEQRHEAARRVVLGLRALARTIESAQAEHGFSAALVLAPEIAMIQQLDAEVLD